MTARRTSRLLGFCAIALTVALAGVTGASAAPLAVEHQSAAFSDVDGDGIYRPGDQLRLLETLHSLDTLALNDLRGSLFAIDTPGVNFPGSNVRAFPPVPAGGTTTNTDPFEFALDPAFECGRPIELSLDVRDGDPPARLAGESVTLPSFFLQTGTQGPWITYPSSDVPTAIADNGTTDSALQIATVRRIKGIRVLVGSVTHPATDELSVSLVPPSGSPILLAPAGSGDDFTGSVFGVPGVPALASLVNTRQDGTWKLRVQDTATGNTGTIDDWSLQIAPATCASAPVASLVASPSTALPGATVDFDASASVPVDESDPIASYEWDWDWHDGDDDWSAPAADATESHSYGAMGAYSPAVRITTQSGLKDVASIALPITTPPSAAFSVSPSSPLSGDQATLDGSGSSDPDPGGSIASYDWDLDGDGSFETHSPGATVTKSWATSGDHEVRLRVTDNHGATAVAIHTVTVQNRSPVAALTVPAPATTGAPSLFDASASSDPDGEIVKYEWDLDGNGSYEQDTGGVASAQHTYSATGTVSASVRTTDNQGATNVKTVDVTVAQAPAAVIEASPLSAKPGAQITFDASDSTDDGPIESLTYRWDFDGDGSWDTSASTSPTTEHSYPAGGSFAARVLVRDAQGATATATLSPALDIHNTLPGAALVAQPAAVTAGDLVVFDASGSSDPDGAITRYEFDLDGSGGFEVDAGASAVTARSYPNPGLLIARVRVTDDTLGTQIATTPVTIAQAAAAAGGGAGVLAPLAVGGPQLGGGGGAGAGASALLATLTGSATQRLKQISKGGVRLACRATATATCSVALEVSAKDAIKLKLAKKKNRKAVVVGQASAATSGGADAKLAIRVSSKVTAAVKKGKRVKLTARATASSGGAIARAARTITLRK